MNKDKALEELFLAQKPEFDDSADFMASLTKRLDAVEYIKQYEEAALRRYKMAMVVSLVVGFISGGATMVLLLSLPDDASLFPFHVQSGLFLWLADNARIIVATTLALLMSLGVISIVKNVQDIMHIRQKRHQALGFLANS
jgi:hypothetical protein